MLTHAEASAAPKLEAPDWRELELEGVLRSESEAGLRELFASGALAELLPDDDDDEANPLEY
jgi:hypothetical protein